MLPRKRTESAEDGNGRGGFEVHVIGGGRSTPADSGGRGPEMGLRIGVGETRERVKVSAAGDPVHRLQPSDELEPMQARPMSEAGPALPQVESGRRRKRRRGLAHWTGWMAAATVLLAVLVVGGMTLAGKKRNANRAAGSDYVFEPVTALDQDHQYFLEHAGELIEETEAVLQRYADATSVDQVLPLVRNGEQVEERLKRWWRPWGPESRFAPGDEISSHIPDQTGRPAIVLSGRKGDFSRFEMVFVREGERMKLDWEASEGVGEVQIVDLQESSTAAGGLVRAVVRPATFYTSDFPEAEFRSYQLADAGGEHFLWGFARIGSPVVAAFDAEFNEGSVLLEKSEEVRATLRLARTGGGVAKCHEITEMLHKGWVSP
jgi:hypothetical protein